MCVDVVFKRVQQRLLHRVLCILFITNHILSSLSPSLKEKDAFQTKGENVFSKRYLGPTKFIYCNAVSC